MKKITHKTIMKKTVDSNISLLIWLLNVNITELVGIYYVK